ncbi:PASTA domain-containing protein [Micromonospora sp. WMMC241]|uniref:PASTA domain-containing protein n=1 Tax=Micromonospora sp. WMMC241 TaxID=3015159 RepID=UPI0022B73872|nr:PASTA domain-containing protein [Micromonospora sp. WMMC241]MCZ7440577.1 PASTA domain-containing protein [Micromonospora sp. WMMC241]
MTEAVDAMTDDQQPVREETGPGRSRLLVGGGLAVALLAVIGGSVGWVLAGEPDRPTASSEAAPPPAAPSSPPTAVTPSADRPGEDRPTGTRSTTPAGLTVPELVGTDFEQARQELRDRRLGWRLVFGSGSGRDVERTSPRPGAPVKRGVTVTVWVAGPAPAVTVPDLGGRSCSDAADALVEAGLYPRYRTGRQGAVTAQEPVAGGAARWNDQVTLTCGTAPADPPTAVESPTP